MANVQKFLVKVAPTATGSKTWVSISNSSVPFVIAPLFEYIETGQQIGISKAATWHILEPLTSFDSENPWDVCHEIVRTGLNFTGGSAQPIYAEPDFAQQWDLHPREGLALALSASCDATPQDSGEQGYPAESDNFWYRNADHGQYQNALKQIPELDGQRVVRVAHLDTGYDPEHESLPMHLDRELQRSFVNGDDPNSAADTSSGIFNNLGHGTGTLSILAGSPVGNLGQLGIAPFLEVVPLRVADRVGLFYNSAVARALDYIVGLSADTEKAVQIVTMSLGGLASRAWADAVNALYDAGITVVTAAGNNYGNLPTRNIVYPARFNRVIAACGVMADHRAYADLPANKMAGNYGPAKKMRTALAAYTPNIPWAKFGCESVVRFNGGGTSAATPQVAAAAAMWIQKHRTAFDAYDEGWMKVEAVRDALFNSASNTDSGRLGAGQLRAFDALERKPAPSSILRREELDSASFAILKVLTGLGLNGMNPSQREMLELEALQLSQTTSIEAILPDPDTDPDTLTLTQRSSIAKAIADHPRASNALRAALASQVVPASSPIAAMPTDIEQLQIQRALKPQIPEPPGRRLRVYAYDPSMSRKLETSGLNEAILSVRWEGNLAPGPVGEYIEVVDIDPASGCSYAPIDLNDGRLLATDGLCTSEANPQFHQQMAYAVAMKTIEYFERALGRVALWSTRFEERLPLSNAHIERGNDEQAKHKFIEHYVQRLRIYPHALRADNAYYSPEHKALLLGYFSSRVGKNQGNSELIFSALSHDIIAHETTHALLDGLHRRFREPTNPDVLAFHEAFSDIVALFQHFSVGESLRDQIASSRGDLSQDTLLSKLAVQFGEATGHHGALRDMIGKKTVNAKGEVIWTRVLPTPKDYQASEEAHDRGKVLVAAVFDAFLMLYARRSIIPIRLATNGSEVLPAGALSTQLADALTIVATKLARHVLTICIRALDYCPPVDITFSDFLRAVITADHDLIPNDPYGYRVAFVTAFSARGIYPQNVRSLSVDTMVWEPPPIPFSTLAVLLAPTSKADSGKEQPQLKLSWDLQSNRRSAWNLARENASVVRRWLMDTVSDAELGILGLRREPERNFALKNAKGDGVNCDLRGIEVHSVRPLRRVGPDGQFLSQLVVEITQSLHAKDGSGLVYRGGVTLIIDLTKKEVSYMVRKRFDNGARVTQQQGLWDSQSQDFGNNYTGVQSAQSEPFALLHKHRKEYP